MKITYLYHSGFLVGTETANFLFDYWQGDLPECIKCREKEVPDTNTATGSGRATGSGQVPGTGSRKPLYVFISHSHEDHYNPAVFDLNADAYICSFEMKPHVSEKIKSAHRVFFLKPHQGLELLQEDGRLTQVLSGKTFPTFDDLRKSAGNIKWPEGPDSDSQEYIGVYTLASNDLGVAFCVSAPEGDIYHAGDLNNWWWDGDAEDQSMERFYLKELGRIRGTRFEAALIPYDLRLKKPGYGIRDFLSAARSDVICPMHVGTSREVAARVFFADPDIKAALAADSPRPRIVF